MLHVIFCWAALQFPVQGGDDLVTSVPLGEELSAVIDFEQGCKFLYLPGREIPIAIDRDVWVREAKLSEDRRTLLISLWRDRSDTGADYMCCLYCQRSDTSATATWTAKFVLHATTLDLMFDRTTRLESIESISNDGTASLKIARDSARVPPCEILRPTERWNVVAEKRLSEKPAPPSKAK